MGEADLEQELLSDLEAMPERLADEEFCLDLYRALANNAWRKAGHDGRLSLSWKRADEFINAVRERHGLPPVERAQSGGEGEVSDLIREALGPRGWTWEPLDTSEHQPDHVTSAEDPPPPDQGERQSPVSAARAWERQAHEEAERTRTGADPVPATHG